MMATAALKLRLLLLVTFVFFEAESVNLNYVGCLDLLRRDGDIVLVNPGSYSAGQLTNAHCAEKCLHLGYSLTGVRDHENLCFCGSLANNTEMSTVCKSVCQATSQADCAHDADRMMLFDTPAEPSVSIVELEPGDGTFTSEMPIFAGVDFPKGVFPPWAKLEFTIDTYLGQLADIYEPVHFEIDFGDGSHTTVTDDASAIYHTYSITGSYTVVVTLLSSDDAAIATSSYEVKIALPLQLFGENIITADCPKDVVVGDSWSCKATVPSGTDLTAVLNFGKTLHVGSYSFADTEIHYIGSAWDDSTPTAAGDGGLTPDTQYMKVRHTVQDAESLLIAADVEVQLPNTVLEFMIIQAENGEDDCREKKSSTVSAGVSSCSYPGRYSFAKRACVGETSELSTLPANHTVVSFLHSFPDVGNQRVYFDSPIILKKGDILGVKVRQGGLVHSENDNTPDCVTYNTLTCSDYRTESRVRFMILGSSKVMVIAPGVPPSSEGNVTVEWDFQNAIDEAQAEDILEYAGPITNVAMTGLDIPLVSEIQGYEVTFDGTADFIHWSFGDGDEIEGAGCLVAVNKTWWFPGSYNMVVTVSNKLSSVSVGMAVRAGLLPYIDFHVWTYEVPRGEVAVLEFENGLVSRDGRFTSGKENAIKCYASTSITGDHNINMTSASGSTVWKPTTNEWNQYIKFFFSELSYISGVKTAGHPDLEEWVTEFKLYYHIRWGTWKPVLKPDGSDRFRGNFDGSTVVETSFPTLLTDGIKLVPTLYHGNIAVRMEVIGIYQGDVVDSFEVVPGKNVTVSDDAPIAFQETYSVWDDFNIYNISLTKNGSKGAVSFYTDDPATVYFTVMAFNDWGSDSFGVNVQFADPIVYSGRLLAESIFSFNESVMAVLRLDSGDLVSVLAVTLDGTDAMDACTQWNDDQKGLNCTFNPGIEFVSVGEHLISVKLKNRISGVVWINDSFTVVEAIDGLSLTVSDEYVDVNQEVQFSYSLLKGTNVTVSLTVGIESFEFHHACASCEHTEESVHETFRSTGYVFVSVMAMNAFNSLRVDSHFLVVGNVEEISHTYESIVEKTPNELAVTTVEFQFEDSLSEMPHEVNIICETLTPIGKYMTVFSPLVTMDLSFQVTGSHQVLCEVSNPVSSKNFEMTFEVEERIAGFTVSVHPRSITMLESVSLNASVTNGSRVFFDLNWGDGESDLFSPGTLPSNLEHVYRKWGAFLIEVSARNELGTTDPAVVSIDVATPEDGCILFRDTYYIRFPGGAEFITFPVDLLVPSNLTVPNLAEYKLFLDDQLYLTGILSPTDPEGGDALLVHVTTFVVRKESPGPMHIEVEVEKNSENYFQTCYWDALIVETVGEVTSQMSYAETASLNTNVSGSSWRFLRDNPFGYMPVALGSTVEVSINVVYGSMRSYVWDFELLESEESTCISGLSTEEAVCYFWLSHLRDFLFSVNITNPVSHHLLYQGVSIFEPVGAVIISGPSNIVRVFKNVAFDLEISSLGTDSCYKFVMEQTSGGLEIEAYLGLDAVCDLLFQEWSPERVIMEDLFGYSDSRDEAGVMMMGFIHNFTVDGMYHLSVIGRNLVSETGTHFYQEVLEPACYQPEVDVAGQNVCGENSDCREDNTTKLYSTSDTVEVLSRVRLNCSSSYRALYFWSVYLLQEDGSEVEYVLPDGVVVTGYTLGVLSIPPAILRYGTYRIQLNVTMEDAEHATNHDSTFVAVDASLLVAKISGGDFRTIPWGTPTTIDGISASYDPNVGQDDKSGLTFFWFCRRKTYRPSDGRVIDNVETFETWSYDFTTKLAESVVNPEAARITEVDVGGCFGRYGGEDSPLPGGLLSHRNGILELPTTSMFVNMEYEFKLVVKSGDLQAEDVQTWSVLEGNYPQIGIRCLENCAERVNPTDRLALEALIDTSFPILPFYRWELHGTLEDGTDVIESRAFWSNFTTTGDSSAAVTLLPGIFQENVDYYMVLHSSWSEDFVDSAEAIYHIDINESPSKGSCEATVYEGIALVDQFSFFCYGWEDVHVPLVYTFKARVVGTSTTQIFHSASKSFTEQTTFQAGLEEYDYNIEILISVHDKLGACTQIDPIIIKCIPGLDALSEDALLVLSDMQIQFLETSANGETGVATNIAMNIFEVLNQESKVETELVATLETPGTNVPPTLGPGSDTISLSPIDINTRISIRTEVINWLAQTDTPTVEGVEQTATAVARATEIAEEVSEEAQELAIDVAIKYGNKLRDLSKVESTVDDSLKSATDTVLLLADNIVASALVKINTSMTIVEEVTNFDIYEEDYDIALQELEVEYKDVLNKAETTISTSSSAVEKCQDVVSQIQAVIEETLVADETPTLVRAPGITVACSKTRPLSNSTDASMMSIKENCSVTLPDVNSFMKDGFNVSSATVWVVDMALFEYNMRPSDVTSYVSSESLSVKMRDSDTGEPLEMRNLSDAFHLTIPQRQDFIAINAEKSKTYYNESNPRGAAMAIHKIYVPWSNALSLNFEAGAFQEMELNVVYNFTFHILLKQDSAPKFFDFDLMCNLTQQLWLTEEPPKNRRRTDLFKVSISGEKQCFFDNEMLDMLRKNASSVYFRVGVTHTFNANESAQNTTTFISSESAQNTPNTPNDNTANLSMTSILYKLHPELCKCLFSSETGSRWKSVGCRVLPTSSISKTDCACNHLTLFGGGFSIPINSIDLSDSAFTKLDENPVVFIFLLSCLCVYAVIIVWARKKDKRDLEKTGVTPLPDNDPRDKFLYEVTVFTGFKAKSGTTAKVSINITGDKGETGPRPFVDEKRKVFQQGGVDSFLLATPEPIGELQFLHVWHNNTGSDASWFLSRVSVKDLRTEKLYYFIVDQWLAVEEDDGKIERVCPVAGKSELTAFGFLFYSKSRKNLSDGHLWFSIFARPYKSTFTRVQRTTCCLSLLFTTMMANIFFYNVELVDGNQTELFKLGPITLTVGEVIIGCISGLMVFPINLIVVNIFRSVKPAPRSLGFRRWLKRKIKRNGVSNIYSRSRSHSTVAPGSSLSVRPLTATSINAWMEEDALAEQELERERDILDGKVKPSVHTISGNPLQDFTSHHAAVGDHRLQFEPVAGFKRTAKKKKKKRFMLPWYFVYLGWALVIASVAVSFWLTIEVAGTFGREKSQEWLLSIGISLVQDIFLAQPIKVLLIALFFSLIIKKPEEEEENANELSIPHLADDEEYLHERMTLEELNDPSKLAVISEMKRRRSQLAELPNFDDLEQSRTLRLKEIRMRKILVEIIFYIIFLNVIMIISFGDRDFNSFWMSRSMSNMFVDARYHGKMKFTMVKNRTGFWNWTDHTLIPSLHSLSWYNGDPDLPGRGQHQVADQTMSMIGTPRFRQVRVMKGHCSIPGAMSRTVDSCKDKYSIAANDAGFYNESWELPFKNPVKGEFRTYPKSVWGYQDWIKLKSIPYPGYHGLYDGGGYLAQLGKTPRESWRVTRYLKESKWIDQYTRAVFIEFVVYNPAVNLFCASFLIMEFLPQGGASAYVYFIPMKLDRYHSSVAYFVLAGEVVYVCFIIYFMFREFYNIRKEKAAYFKSLWNILEVTTIILALLGLVCYVYQLILSRELLTQYREEPKRFLNFQYVSTWAEFHNWFVSGVLFIATLKFLRLLRFNRRLQLLALTFKGSGKEIIAYTVVFGIVFMAYACAAYQLFHLTIYDFSTIVTTVESLFATIMGKFKFDEMIRNQRFFGPLFFFSFVMLMIFILMSMFLSIINAAFRKVRISNEMEENELEMVNFIMSRFLRWTGFSKRRMRKSVKARTRYIEGVDPVTKECEELRSKLDIMITKLQTFVVQERREAFGLRGDEGKARRIFIS